MSEEDIFEVANAIVIKPFERKRVFFSINLGSMCEKNEVNVGRALSSREFLSKAEPTRMDRELFACVKDQGISLVPRP